MKTKLSNIMMIIQAVAALCMIGAVKFWAPVCGKMLELVSGKQVPMKCFYTGQAAMAIAVIILVVAIVGIIAKEGHRKLMIVNIASAVILFLVFTSIIGVCANTEMRCHVTALWGKIVAGVVLVTSVVELIGGKEDQVPN